MGLSAPAGAWESLLPLSTSLCPSLPVAGHCSRGQLRLSGHSPWLQVTLFRETGTRVVGDGQCHGNADRRGRVRCLDQYDCTRDYHQVPVDRRQSLGAVGKGRVGKGGGLGFGRPGPTLRGCWCLPCCGGRGGRLWGQGGPSLGQGRSWLLRVKPGGLGRGPPD